MKSVVLSVTIFLVGQSAVFGSETTAAYVDQTVLLFKAESLIKHRLPARTTMPYKPAISAMQLNLACAGLNAGFTDLLVYQTHDQKCFRLSDLSLSKVTTILGPQGFLPLSADRLNLEQSLNTDAVVIIQPQMAAAFIPLSCSCPEPLPDPVFSDGFESN